MTDEAKISGPLAARLPLGLFVLRISLGLFLLQWTVEKFVLPPRTVGIFKGFYGVDLAGVMPQILGGIELILVLALLCGAYKRISYGLALLIHTVSVTATWKQLIDPWGFIWGEVNHLFTAGVPLLIAFWLLYYLRDWDTKWSYDESRASTGDPGNSG